MSLMVETSRVLLWFVSNDTDWIVPRIRCAKYRCVLWSLTLTYRNGATWASSWAWWPRRYCPWAMNSQKANPRGPEPHECWAWSWCPSRFCSRRILGYSMRNDGRCWERMMYFRWNSKRPRCQWCWVWFCVPLWWLCSSWMSPGPQCICKIAEEDDVYLDQRHTVVVCLRWPCKPIRFGEEGQSQIAIKGTEYYKRKSGKQCSNWIHSSTSNETFKRRMKPGDKLRYEYWWFHG